MVRYLIATSKYPNTKEAGLEVFASIRNWAKEEGVQIGPVMHWTHGPGCTNLSFEANSEEFAEKVCRALGPIARWTNTNSPLPEVDTVDCF